jgi:hypothetical protein
MSGAERECEEIAEKLRRKFKGLIVSFDTLEADTGWIISVVSQEKLEVIGKHEIQALLPDRWVISGIEGAESRGNVFLISRYQIEDQPQ